MAIDDLLKKLKPTINEEETRRIWTEHVSVDDHLRRLIETHPRN